MDKGMKAVRPLILVAKGGDARLAEGGGKSWEVIAGEAQMIPGCPDVTEESFRRLVTDRRTMPDDGTELRYLLAALDVPLLGALRLAGYFPDLRWSGMSAIQMLSDLAAAAGVPFRVTGQGGGKVAIEFVRRPAP